MKVFAHEVKVGYKIKFLDDSMTQQSGVVKEIKTENNFNLFIFTVFDEFNGIQHELRRSKYRSIELI